MVNFEDHYGKQDSAKQNEADARHIRQYNTWVRLINELTGQMIQNAKTNPPEHCDWVIEDGETKVSWNLKAYDDFDGSPRINLTSDGNLVFVEDYGYPGAKPSRVIRTITLREISRIEEEQQRDINWSHLASLFHGVVTWGLGTFNIPLGDFHGADRKHWGSDWSSYH